MQNLLILFMLAGDFFIHAIDRWMDATSIAAVRIATTLGGILVTLLQHKQKIAALSVLLQNWRLRQIQNKEERFQEVNWTGTLFWLISAVWNLT